MKKIPMRKCVVNQEQFPKKELIRVCRTPEGQVIVDRSGRSNGRGAYLKGDLQTIELAVKRKVLARALECEIPNEIYDELRAMVSHES